MKKVFEKCSWKTIVWSPKKMCVHSVISYKHLNVFFTPQKDITAIKYDLWWTHFTLHSLSRKKYFSSCLFQNVVEIEEIYLKIKTFRHSGWCVLVEIDCDSNIHVTFVIIIWENYFFRAHSFVIIHKLWRKMWVLCLKTEKIQIKRTLIVMIDLAGEVFNSNFLQFHSLVLFNFISHKLNY
jgi:hypothetical protein